MDIVDSDIFSISFEYWSSDGEVEIIFNDECYIDNVIFEFNNNGELVINGKSIDLDVESSSSSDEDDDDDEEAWIYVRYDDKLYKG